MSIAGPSEISPRAVLIDVLGTLLFLEPPAPALRRELRACFGADFVLEDVERAVGAEIRFYREHHLEGRDSASLADLRRRCAGVLAAALPAPGPDLDRDELLAALLGSLRFEPFPDALEALGRLRAATLRLVAVSNWDCGLDEVLDRTGLAGALDGVVSSAGCGAAKPDPAIFVQALRVAGVPAERALHCGNEPEEDVAGARRAGVRAVLISRDGRPVPEGVPVIRTLSELPELVA